MARLPRLFVPELPQHAVQRARAGETAFVDDEEYGFYLEALAEQAPRQGCALHAYVLMPDHVHLLCTPGDAGAIGRLFQALGRRHVQQINARRARGGGLWAGRYRATVLEPQRYLLSCMRYLEDNPVRAGLVADAGDWRWSSHLAHIGLAPRRLLTPHPLFLALADSWDARWDAWRQYYEQGCDALAPKRIREATTKGWALGDKSFQVTIAPLANRRPAPARPGRPRAGAD